MTKKEQFHAIRRAHRAAARAARRNAPDENAALAYITTGSALRAFTGNFDCCWPAWRTDELIPHPRLWVKRPFVAAACTRWLATH